MYKIFAGIFLVFLLSCEGKTDSLQYVELQNQVTQLNQRIDSLITVLTVKENEKPKVVKPKTKKNTVSNTLTTRVPQSSSSSSYSAYSSSPKQSSSSNSGRCQAITKKGFQCSRSARSGGYCWQHGG